MDDIIIPKGNEQEFLEIVAALGISKPFFCYPYNDYNQKKQSLSSYQEVSVGIISSHPNEIRKAKQKGIFVITQSNDRKVLESSPSLIFEIELSPFKDGIHSRNSGMNHVLSTIMKGKTILGVSTHSLISSPTQTKLLGRMRQNLKIARKAGLEIQCFSFARHPYEIRSPIDRKHFLSSQL